MPSAQGGAPQGDSGRIDFLKPSKAADRRRIVLLLVGDPHELSGFPSTFTQVPVIEGQYCKSGFLKADGIGGNEASDHQTNVHKNSQQNHPSSSRLSNP